jgi:hypothetical protein
MRTATKLRDIYDLIITDHRRDLTFIVLLFFLPTFIVSRAMVYTAPDIFINAGGVHIHHFTWGILLLAITGYASLILHSTHARRRIAAIYGIGLALAFDEFGMWLNLKDDYHIRQSYDAILIITAWLINTIYFADYWERAARAIPRFIKEIGFNGRY